MRFAKNVAFGLFSIALMGNMALADDIDDALGDAATTSSSAAPSSSTAAIEKPTFTPFSISAPFYEQFTEDWDSRWKVSHAKKELKDKDAKEEWAYIGQWAVEEPTVLKGIEGDKGLVVKNVAAHHAISAKFNKPIDNTGKTLVVQYEVKLQNGLDCGGAYVKLLKENADLHAEEFSNASPYVIMFGPDKCGATNKVHFIFKHKNPKTGEYEEKHLKTPPVAKITKQTTLYTLIVKPDQTFDILIDGKSAKNGTLLDDFYPSVNPPKEIDDPEDKKPSDWVDIPQIPDPDAKKPDDWDEDAPVQILDEDAKKPDDWLEDEPDYIPDPEAKKPEDWDDEEDGDWIAPTIPNPKCAEISGCGKWERPMKANPAYKGKWTAPMIENPAYKGEWKPRKIPNPDYYEDKAPANFEPIGAIGYELWTMTNDILFDNIYVGHSVEDAKKLQAATFDIKKPIEDAEEEATAPKAPEPPKAITFKDDPIAFLKGRLDPFLIIVQKDPVGAFKAFPEVAGALAAAVGTILALLFGLISLATSPAKVKKIEPKKAVEKGKEAVKAESSSSSENEKPKATRRTSKKA